MSAEPCLMGIETEYATVGVRPAGARLNPRALAGRLMECAAARFPHLPGGRDGGLFLQNGGRLSVDAGYHPEFSTPECGDPWELVRQVAAGDRILATLAADVEAQEAGLEVMVFKGNVDYSGSGATWGCHESYLHRGPPTVLREQLVPHLVSRIIYSGAGGFDPLSPGLVFTLSPRVRHITHVLSADRLGERGIVHLRDQPLAGSPYRRLHLLCGESQCSELAGCLKLGATALVVRLVELGLRPACEVALASPLDAMRSFAADPTLTVAVPARNGTPLTAMTIQRHYLTMAEQAQREGRLPPWGERLCRLWRDTLDRLDQPAFRGRALDWAIKHALYTDRASRGGIPWEALPRWTAVAEALASVRAPGKIGRREPAAAHDPIHPTPTHEERKRLAPLLEVHGLRREDYDPFLRLRHQLFELDIRFAQIGPQGLFSTLDRAGMLAHRVDGAGDAEEAAERAPAGGRARVRGDCIRRFGAGAQRAWGMCDWDAIVAGTGAVLDLSDPFLERERWVPPPPPAAPGSPAGAGLVLRHICRGHEGKIGALAWSADGRHLASCGADSIVRVWDPDRGRLAVTLSGHGDWVRGIVWSPYGRRLASIARDRTLRLWDLRDPRDGMIIAQPADPLCVAWSPDGAMLAVGGADARVRLWESPGCLSATLEGHTAPVTAVAWSPDGQTLAAGSAEGWILLWDIRRRQIAQTTGGPGGAIRAVAWSPDGRVFAACGGDTAIHVWDGATGTPVKLLQGHARAAFSVGFSPDGRLLASKGRDSTLRIWRTDRWQCIAEIAEGSFDDWPGGLAFHPRVPVLATRDDRAAAIRVWTLDVDVLLSRPPPTHEREGETESPERCPGV